MRISFALLLSSLALIVVVVVVIAQSTDEEWRDYQLEYLDQAMGRASSDTVRQALAASGLEIQQDTLAGFEDTTRIDRCRTCHMAIDDPQFENGQHPLKTHPKMAGHSFSEFGCTVCHAGNGRGLTTYDAHGDDHFWPEPLLAAPYIESSCARCHPEPYLDETPHLRRGRKLFEKYACVGCHTIRGVSRGKLGPDLTDVGTNFKIDYLTESIVDPKANAITSIMPKFVMAQKDVQALTVFLKSRRGRQMFEDPVTLRIKTKEWEQEAARELSETPDAGQMAFDERFCASCHKLGQEDGKLAPDLSFQGLLREKEYIVAHLSDPRRHTYGSNMPTFFMSESEKKAIAIYLTSLTAFDLPAAPKEQYALLCSRCHGEEGAGDGLIAENLLPRPRQFTNAKFFNWLPEDRAWNDIANGVPGTAMPPFKKILSESQVQELFSWVRSEFLKSDRKKWKRPRPKTGANPVAYSPESIKRGHDAFQLRCYGCHGRIGDGNGPNAVDMLPRPRNLMSTAFMGAVTDQRLFESITYGIVGTGMPAWDYLPKTQRWDLVNFVRSLSKTGPAAPSNGK